MAILVRADPTRRPRCSSVHPDSRPVTPKDLIDDDPIPDRSDRLVASRTLFSLPGSGHCPAGCGTTAATHRAGSPVRPAAGETLQSINDDYNRQLLQTRAAAAGAARPTGRGPGAQGGRRDLRDAVPPGHRQQPVRRGRAGRRRVLKTAEQPVRRSSGSWPRRSTSSPRPTGATTTSRWPTSAGSSARRRSATRSRGTVGLARHPVAAGHLRGLLPAARPGRAGSTSPARPSNCSHEETDNPAVKEYCADRLSQLDMIGKPAPPIQGTDLDGKPVEPGRAQGRRRPGRLLGKLVRAQCRRDRLARSGLRRRTATAGSASWASTSTPSRTAVPSSRPSCPTSGASCWTTTSAGPTWSTATGAHDYAKAYGVTEIPTNVLIGRDGTVIHLDLSRKNLGRSSPGRREAVSEAAASTRRTDRTSLVAIANQSEASCGRSRTGCRRRPSAAGGLAAWASDS